MKRAIHLLLKSMLNRGWQLLHLASLLMCLCSHWCGRALQIQKSAHTFHQLNVFVDFFVLLGWIPKTWHDLQNFPLFPFQPISKPLLQVPWPSRIILFFQSIWHILVSSFSYMLLLPFLLFSLSLSLADPTHSSLPLCFLLEDAFLDLYSKISRPAIYSELFIPLMVHNT